MSAPGPGSFRLVVNPSAGRGGAAAAAAPVAHALRAAGATVVLSRSAGPDESRAVVQDACARGEVVVAVGGDGMVGSLAAAVVAEGGLLGIVPVGRGNDFARQLGLRRSPRGAAAALLRRAPRAVDVIRVQTAAGSRVVAGSVYAGVDSRASELVNRARWVPGALQYPYAAVRALSTYRPVTYRVDVDGHPHAYDGCTVVVANSGYYGSGMHVAPDAAADDGLLDVVLVEAASRAALIRALPRVYDGSHVGLDAVHVWRGAPSPSLRTARSRPTATARCSRRSRSPRRCCRELCAC